MAILSVNVNKFATLRNARGGNNPDVLTTALNCEKFGAQGITVHPRPDERHIRKSDVFALKAAIKTELNIEGYPSSEFQEMVLHVKPAQVTLVPDAPEVLTSNAGWDCIKQSAFLLPIIARFKAEGIRTSLFVDPVVDQVKAAKQTGTDRIELYTEAYAKQFLTDRKRAIEPYILAANQANMELIGINAGHDLDLKNLKFFYENIENLLEVSIGHALVCDALYLGLNNTVVAYLNALHPNF